jgi:hypothetical protein
MRRNQTATNGLWRNPVLPKLGLTLLILTAQFIPPLPLYFDVATSMALGTTLAAALIILLCWLSEAFSPAMNPRPTFESAVGSVVAVTIMIALILIHAIVADALLPIDVSRSIGSLIPLAFLVGGGFKFGTALLKCGDRTVDFAASASLSALCAVIVLEFSGFQPRLASFPKSMFPFTEISHFALAFTPILLYFCVRAKRSHSLWWVIGGFALALSLQSIALVIGCLLAALVCRRLLLVALAAGLLLIAGLPLGIEYYAIRLNFSGSVLNLSNLVYVQGWELVPESFARTLGWGLGFNQLGIRGTDVPAAVFIHAITNGDEANITDGSFVFSKLASEFGVLGVLLSFVYVFAAAHCVRALRKGGGRAAIVLAQCIVVAYGVDMFVRGTGYFVQSTFLFVAASAALLANGRARKLQVWTRSLLRNGVNRESLQPDR